MKLKHLFILLACAIVFSNCKKNTDKPEYILVSKTWKRGTVDKNIASNPQGSVPVVYQPLQNCEKDDIFKFTIDGSLVIDKQSDRCNLNELQKEIVAYTLNRETKEFIIDEVKFTLLEESIDQIKYYTVITSGSEIQYLVFLLQ